MLLNELLQEKLPDPKASSFTVNDLIGACLTVTTGDYVYEAIPQVQSAITKKIDDEYKEKIDFESLREGTESECNLGHIMNAGIQTAVSGITRHVENELKAMAQVNWASLEMVGDQSSYISAIKNHLD